MQLKMLQLSTNFMSYTKQGCGWNMKNVTTEIEK